MTVLQQLTLLLLVTLLNVKQGCSVDISSDMTLFNFDFSRHRPCFDLWPPNKCANESAAGNCRRTAASWKCEDTCATCPPSQSNTRPWNQEVGFPCLRTEHCAVPSLSCVEGKCKVDTHRKQTNETCTWTGECIRTHLCTGDKCHQKAQAGFPCIAGRDDECEQGWMCVEFYPTGPTVGTIPATVQPVCRPELVCVYDVQAADNLCQERVGYAETCRKSGECEDGMYCGNTGVCGYPHFLTHPVGGTFFINDFLSINCSVPPNSQGKIKLHSPDPGGMFPDHGWYESYHSLELGVSWFVSKENLKSDLNPQHPSRRLQCVFTRLDGKDIHDHVASQVATITVTQSYRPGSRYPQWIDKPKPYNKLPAGSSVTLACKVRNYHHDDLVEWRIQRFINDNSNLGIKDPDTFDVILTSTGTPVQRYHINWQPASDTVGDFSLTISDLTDKDQGIYTCHVHAHSINSPARNVYGYLEAKARVQVFKFRQFGGPDNGAEAAKNFTVALMTLILIAVGIIVAVVIVICVVYSILKFITHRW